MTITYIKATAATLANNSKTITVTGEHVDFSKANDYLVALDNGLYVLPVASGTAPDENGDSTLTLVETWAGATLSNKGLFIFPTFAKIYESVQAMTSLNDVTRGILTKLKDLLTATTPTLDIAVGQTTSIETVPYGYLTNQVSALISQLNGLVSSVQAMTKSEFDRIRINELNNFPVSGHLNVDKATAFDFQQVAGWENKFKIKANKTRIDGVWHDYADTTITNFEAPNGLQNKDLVSADFVDLAAAIVAGGTDLSQSYLRQRVAHYMVQDDIVAAPAQSVAYIQDPKNNFYADNGILRQRVITFEKARLLESVVQEKGQLFTNSVNAMTSLGWSLSTEVLGQFEKSGKKAVYIATINSLNQGGLHPNFNPAGTKKYRYSQANPSYIAGWNVLDNSGNGITSVSQCFDLKTQADASNGSLGTSDYGGNIGTSSARPDENFYDAIYASYVHDSRMSIRRLSAANIREKNHRMAIAGDVNGLEGVPFSYPRTDAGSGNYVSASKKWSRFVGGFNLYIDIDAFSERVKEGDWLYLHDKTAGIIIRFLAQTVVGGTQDFVQNTSVNDASQFQVLQGTITEGDDGTGHDVVYILEKQQAHKQANPTWTDIIGDPANIATTFPNGVEGQWKPIINLGTYNYKLNRRNTQDSNPRFEQFTIGSGWSNGTLNRNVTLNTVALTNNSNQVTLAHYETQAHFTQDDVNGGGNMLTLGNVWAGNDSTVNRGCLLQSSLIGKIGVNNTGQPRYTELPLRTYSRFPGGDTRLVASDGWFPTHDTIDIAGIASTVKTLDYLSSQDGVAKLCFAYKEMVYDSEADASQDFTEVTVGTSFTYVSGQYYKFTHADFGNLRYKVFLCKQNRDASASWIAGNFLSNQGELLHVANNDTSFVLWDGNGWGDNNQFEITDNQSTFTDDNGNNVLYGTASFETQYFISEV